MQEYVLTPAFIERSIEPSILGPEMARILQGVDVTYLGGRVRRDLGYARTQVPSSTTAITSCGIFERYDSNRMVVDGSADGTVRIIVPLGADGCPRSIVEWDDETSFITTPIFAENFEEEPGNDGAGY